MELRAATDADWPRAWAIQREAFLDSVTRTYGGWTEEQVRKCEEAWDAAQTRIIEVDGRFVGWVRVVHEAERDWLDLIVVSAEARGSGLGTAVMEALVAQAHARGVPLWLSVYRTNPARRLYRRLGFGERDRDDIRVWMWSVVSSR